MPLPKLETNKYTTVVPSTQKTIEFRPFLVKEEKILMIAQESNDSNQIIQALCDIIDVCTFGKVKAKDLTTYDLEYLFLQLRAKSIGETTEIILPCDECGHENTVVVDLSSIEVVFPEKKVDNKIQLNDEVGIILRPISVSKSKEITRLKEDNVFSASIAACIESIYDEDAVYPTDETSPKELEEFIDSLSHSHLESIQEYISHQPVLQKEVKYTCSSCGHTNTVILKGLESFF